MNSRKILKNKKNKQKNSRKLWLAGAAAGLVVLAGVAGTFVYKFNTSDVTIAQGNQAFAAQEYDAALAKYQSAQQSAPIFAEPFYNAANVLYKQSKFEEAGPLLDEALARSNESIAEFIRFNLGNIAFNAQQFEQAIEQYQDALRLNPEDKDAKYNLELALLQQQQQQEQNQDQQNQDQQNQDQQNQDEQNQDQQNQDQQNQDQQNQDQQNQDQQNQDQQNQDQQNQDQKDQRGQQGQDQKDQKDQQGQDQKDQQGQQGQDQKDQQGQQGQDQKDQQGQQGQDQKDQQGQQAQDQKDQQGQQGQQGQDHQQQQQGTGGAGEPTDKEGEQQGYSYVPGELTQEQAEQILAAVGGNSQTLMEKIQQYLYVPGGTPEKDW